MYDCYLEELVESDPPTLTRRLEIIAQVCGEGLDGDRAIQFGVARFPDAAKVAGANQLDQLEVRDRAGLPRLGICRNSLAENACVRDSLQMRGLLAMHGNDL